MKKDNYRKILSEKFRAANQLETGPLTEEDEEYLRILAEARANHAKIKAARQEARKRLAARAAAVFIVAALVSSSYLLGMKSDTKASADPDDEVKVVQQGDNIIIGQGVSEKDENVGVVTHTYYSVEAIPLKFRGRITLLSEKEYSVDKIKVFINNDVITSNVYYHDKNGIELIIKEQIITRDHRVSILEYDVSWKYNDISVYHKVNNEGDSFSFSTEEKLFNVMIKNSLDKKEIEAIVQDLIN